MSARAEHALQRSVRKLAVEVTRASQQKAMRDADTQLAERDEQVQLELNGVATALPAWQSVEVPFEHGFATAHDRRMSTLERPHLAFGYELVSVSDTTTGHPALGAVIVVAAVTAWNIPDGITIDSATVALGAYAPGGSFNFRAIAHLAFQGYGALTDPQPDMEM